MIFYIKIADHDTLVTDKTIFKKKIGGYNLGRMGLNHAQNEIIHHFPEFGSKVFLEIEYEDSL